MGNSHLLFQSLFKKELSSSENQLFLKELTKQYPYFTAAHFFLLKEIASDNADFEKQAAATSLLFNNTFWLNYQLNYSFSEEKSDNELTEHGTKNQHVEKEQTIDEILIKEPKVILEAEDLTELVEIEKNFPPQIKEEEIIVVEPIEENVLPLKLIGETNEVNLPKFVFVKDEEQVMKDFTEEDFEDEIDDKEIEPMNIKLNFTNINTTEDTILFEPLHVSDYFTSVGIKLTEEVKPSDKLGKQLKSFTDWLKTMKKVHVEHLQEEIAENNDILIQQMAEKSNKEGETLTEAMAEVLLQQGMRVKAMKVYQKLSLLYPVKSAYFAAKIDQINK